MDVIITPQKLSGTVQAPASKSVAHRLLITAALGSRPVTITCPETNDDIEATVRCLSALGANISRIPGSGFDVTPIPRTMTRNTPTLDCGESGSTLRFMLPLVAALGASATLSGTARLMERPQDVLIDVLEAHGARISRTATTIGVQGRLLPGIYTVPGNISSQYLTGLLFASVVLDGAIQLEVSEPISSESYVELTIDALKAFGWEVSAESVAPATRRYTVRKSAEVPEAQSYAVEGDWSGAAFWLSAGYLGNNVKVTGLNRSSAQGDAAMVQLLEALSGAGTWKDDTLSVSIWPTTPDTTQPHERVLSLDSTPDLVPPLALAAAFAPGTTRLVGLERLRLKESDRIASVYAALTALGAQVNVEGDTLVISGVNALSGGTVDAANDHRIAMMAAIAATRATAPVRITGAECVSKSYPAFWDVYQELGCLIHKEEPCPQR